jgi:hypothetical protein
VGSAEIENLVAYRYDHTPVRENAERQITEREVRLRRLCRLDPGRHRAQIKCNARNSSTGSLNEHEPNESE